MHNKKDNVVYILGAGFSAPLNIPVMSNFYEKSKDMFANDPIKFNHFSNVFKTINEMHKSKSYYATNLFNIEEILSILEIKEEVGSENERSSFKKYIIDVIKHFTPEITEYPKYPSSPFGYGHSLENYGYFVANLLNIFASQNELRQLMGNRMNPENINAYYSVITLNYDLVLENCVSFLRRHYHLEKNLGFSSNIENDENNFNQTPHLAKLHGSIDTEEIVPPTWNKALHEKIKPAWQLAYKLLVNANQIRIIGYSLPIADAYVKYLLKAAIINCDNLKKIDVICMDDNEQTTRKRYQEFINFPNFRFIDLNVSKYLEQISKRISSDRGVMRFNNLENVHHELFKDIT